PRRPGADLLLQPSSASSAVVAGSPLVELLTSDLCATGGPTRRTRLRT
ncbi:hypothetical protein LSAT2_029582, partial [Lamellibrachia satsuma]